MPTVAGSDVKVECRWDNTMLESPWLQSWEQGQMKFGKPDPSKTVISVPGGVNPMQDNPTTDPKDPNWSIQIFTVDQQLNGFNIYHKLALTATLTSKCDGCAKQRRLGNSDDRILGAADAGKEGTWGFTLNSKFVGLPGEGETSQKAQGFST